jgi:hypothetical protein
MSARTVCCLGALVFVLGCSPTPQYLACETYVAGGFNAENGYALSVDAALWPRLQKPSERIELSFLLATRKPRVVELVHVVGSREIERWKLALPPDDAQVPRCFISPDPGQSTCGASIHVLPHDASGYYYLRTDGDVLEAGMSFFLCSRPEAPLPLPAG